MVGSAISSSSIDVGDLVEFTHPHARDVGIVVRIAENDWRQRCAHVLWSLDPFIESLSVDSEHLKLIRKGEVVANFKPIA